MKKQMFFLIVFSILCVNLFAQLIPDDNFRMRINSHLGQPPGYEPTVADLNGITGHFLANEAEIVSIEGAQHLINITSFRLNSNQIINITPISGLTNLTWLLLSFNQINDITAVSNLTNLTNLDLGCNQINDILAVSNLTNLIYLDLGGNQISDISAVSNLTDLIELNLNGNQINDISAISDLTNLIHLYIGYNQISNISVISNLENLIWLTLELNQISDISAVSDLTNLTNLNSNRNQISDISAVAELTNLIYFRSYSNQISDISAVANLTNLIHLNLSNNEINDVSAVSNLSELTYLNLSYNLISNIPVLSSLSNLYYFSLAGNQIDDISTLPDLSNLYSLNLEDNNICDIYIIVENTLFGPGDILRIESNPLSQEALNIHIPILQSRGFHGLHYPPIPNNYAACYPNPIRNATGLPSNTMLEWRGNYPSRDAVYEVWLGESSDNLEYLGTGSASNDTLYSFTPNLNDDTNYWWKVCAVVEGDEYWSGLWHFAVGNPISSDDQIYSLNTSQIIGNFPNPFNPSTIIKYHLNTSGYTKIEIYNVRGQIVNTLVNQYQTAGEKSIVWNGIDKLKKQVGSSMYFLKLNVNDKTESVRKCLLLK